MEKTARSCISISLGVAIILLLFRIGPALATIQGLSGTTFNIHCQGGVHQYYRRQQYLYVGIRR